MTETPVRTDVPRTLEDLVARYPLAEIIHRVRVCHARHRCKTDFALFTLTYTECKSPWLCDVARARIKADYEKMRRQGEVPLYFVRRLLPS